MIYSLRDVCIDYQNKLVRVRTPRYQAFSAYTGHAETRRLLSK